MQVRRLATCDIDVSVIGLGTVKFGRNEGVKYKNAFTLPTDQEIKNLLAVASDLGINLLDTAPAYGRSEERLGQVLKAQRNNWIITTKVGEEFVAGNSQFDFSPSAIRHSIERSLQRLNTDYLDIVLVHSNGDDVAIIENDEVFVTLSALKQEGKIRAFGMSTKTIAGGLLTIDHADVAMIAYNPAYPDEREVIAYAQQHQKAVFIKKALASGHLEKLAAVNPIHEAMKFIFAEPGVTSVIIGTLNPAHLRECVAQAIAIA